MDFTNAHLTGMLLGGFFVTLLGTLALVAWSLKLNHQKRMRLIEEGQYEAVTTNPVETLAEDWQPRYTLGLGLVATAVGAGWTIEHLIVGPPLDGSLILGFVGVATLAYYFSIYQSEE